MSNPFIQMFDFILQAFLNLCILIFMLRFLLELMETYTFNPLYQFVMRVTNPMIVPIRRLLPTIKRINLSALFCMLLLQGLEVVISDALEGRSIHWIGIAIVAMGELASLLIYIYIFSIIIEAVLNWIAPKQYHPLNEILTRITKPVLYPARRWVPPVAQVDLSPIVVLIFLSSLHILTQWVIHYGDRLVP